MSSATRDFSSLAKLWQRDLGPTRLSAFACSLGVTPDALYALGCGWNGRGCFSFPMHDQQRRVVGIRLRDARTGRKFAVKGSREGAFLHDGREQDRLLVVEGPTDAAAALTLGFDALGRPSCTGAVRITAALSHGRDVVVIADADPPGRRGANALASTLLPTSRSVRVIEPPTPHKDLRAWLQAGATTAQAQSHIEVHAPRRLRVRLEVRR
ncbi:MAG: hypothetical protein IT456_21435 [Planctomycetes bacterium]|nr:hypothetical protein [Planctomycetota bacterium]